MRNTGLRGCVTLTRGPWGFVTLPPVKKVWFEPTELRVFCSPVAKEYTGSSFLVGTHEAARIQDKVVPSRKYGIGPHGLLLIPEQVKASEISLRPF